MLVSVHKICQEQAYDYIRAYKDCEQKPPFGFLQYGPTFEAPFQMTERTRIRLISKPVMYLQCINPIIVRPGKPKFVDWGVTSGTVPEGFHIFNPDEPRGDDEPPCAKEVPANSVMVRYRMLVIDRAKPFKDCSIRERLKLFDFSPALFYQFSEFQEEFGKAPGGMEGPDFVINSEIRPGNERMKFRSYPVKVDSLTLEEIDHLRECCNSYNKSLKDFLLESVHEHTSAEINTLRQMVVVQTKPKSVPIVTPKEAIREILAPLSLLTARFLPEYIKKVEHGLNERDPQVWESVQHVQNVVNVILKQLDRLRSAVKGVDVDRVIEDMHPDDFAKLRKYILRQWEDSAAAIVRDQAVHTLRYENCKNAVQPKWGNPDGKYGDLFHENISLCAVIVIAVYSRIRTARPDLPEIDVYDRWQQLTAVQKDRLKSYILQSRDEKIFNLLSNDISENDELWKNGWPSKEQVAEHNAKQAKQPLGARPDLVIPCKLKPEAEPQTLAQRLAPPLKLTKPLNHITPEEYAESAKIVEESNVCFEVKTARSSVGMSLITLEMAKAAFEKGYDVLWVTLEMLDDPEKTWKLRTISKEVNMPLVFLPRKDWSPVERIRNMFPADGCVKCLSTGLCDDGGDDEFECPDCSGIYSMLPPDPKLKVEVTKAQYRPIDPGPDPHYLNPNPSPYMTLRADKTYKRRIVTAIKCRRCDGTGKDPERDEPCFNCKRHELKEQAALAALRQQQQTCPPEPEKPVCCCDPVCVCPPPSPEKKGPTCQCCYGVHCELHDGPARFAKDPEIKVGETCQLGLDQIKEISVPPQEVKECSMSINAGKCLTDMSDVRGKGDPIPTQQQKIDKVTAALYDMRGAGPSKELSDLLHVYEELTGKDKPEFMK